jgi:hypothetical protein
MLGRIREALNLHADIMQNTDDSPFEGKKVILENCHALFNPQLSVAAGATISS